MSNLNSPNVDITKILQSNFEKLPSDGILLLQTPIDTAPQINAEAIKLLQEAGYEGIYITLSQAYVELVKTFQINSVSLDKLAVIDAISKLYGIEQIKNPKVIYVDGPLSMNAISEGITQINSQITNTKKFVFFDSVTTILLYNSLERTLNFIDFLIQSFKKMHLIGILVSVSEGSTNQKLIEELMKTANEYVNISHLNN